MLPTTYLMSYMSLQISIKTLTTLTNIYAIINKVSCNLCAEENPKDGLLKIVNKVIYAVVERRYTCKAPLLSETQQ